LQELKIIEKNDRFQGFSRFCWFSAAFLVSVISFGTFVLMDPNNKLGVINLFVSIYLFDLIKFVVNIGPIAFSSPVKVTKI
jgi:ATP-binding cassette subfamily C (CFTR/MRP) protein 1